MHLIIPEDGMCNSDEDSPVAGKMRRKILSPINQDRVSIDVETLEEHHKQDIERLTAEFEQAVTDLQDSYDVRLVKLNAQLEYATADGNVKNASAAKVDKLSSELLDTKQLLEKQIQVNSEEKETHRRIIEKFEKEVTCYWKILEETEKNHLADKNELITRLEHEHDERMEETQAEWYERLEALRQESGDELEAGLDEMRKCDHRRSGAELLKQLEEQKLLMMRKYKNLKSQLLVTTEELEMALAREAQAEELHIQLQKRCLKVEERLIQMANGVDTSSETSSEFIANLSEDQQGKNRPQEVVVAENTQLKRRIALLLNRCEVLERSLHAAKAREYFGQSYGAAESMVEGRTDEDLREIEFNHKVENLESRLQLAQQEIQMSKVEVEMYWKDIVDEQKKGFERNVNDLKAQNEELKSNIRQFQKENHALKKLCEQSNVKDVFVRGAEALSGKMREDFERLVRIQVQDMWQQILQGGESALSGQLKEDFNTMLNKAAHRIEETLLIQFNEEKERIQKPYKDDNNKLRK